MLYTVCILCVYDMRVDYTFSNANNKIIIYIPVFFKFIPCSAKVLYWPYNSNIVYIGTGNGNLLFVVVQVELTAGLLTSARVLLCEETVYWNKVIIPSQ